MPSQFTTKWVRNRVKFANFARTNEPKSIRATHKIQLHFDPENGINSTSVTHTELKVNSATHTKKKQVPVWRWSYLSTYLLNKYLPRTNRTRNCRVQRCVVFVRMLCALLRWSILIVTRAASTSRDLDINQNASMQGEQKKAFVARKGIKICLSDLAAQNVSIALKYKNIRSPLEKILNFDASTQTNINTNYRFSGSKFILTWQCRFPQIWMKVLSRPLPKSNSFSAIKETAGYRSSTKYWTHPV